MNASQLSQQSWYIVNDSVMGGISRSRLAWLTEEQVIRFSGNLSLERNGGFASVRLLLDEPLLAGKQAVCIQVRGDGREYQLRLRGDQRTDGVAYRYSFQTVPDEWMTYTLPVADFEPVFRGRLLQGYEQAQPERIRQIGFMLADKQPGDFQLDIAGISSC